MSKLKLNPKDNSRADGIEACPKCGYNKWKTVQNEFAWRCRGCGIVRYVKPLGEK